MAANLNKPIMDTPPNTKNRDASNQTFDFSTVQGFMDAIAACVRELGGEVINNPSEQTQGGN